MLFLWCSHYKRYQKALFKWNRVLLAKLLTDANLRCFFPGHVFTFRAVRCSPVEPASCAWNSRSASAHLATGNTYRRFSRGIVPRVLLCVVVPDQERFALRWQLKVQMKSSWKFSFRKKTGCYLKVVFLQKTSSLLRMAENCCCESMCVISISPF